MLRSVRLSHPGNPDDIVFIPTFPVAPAEDETQVLVPALSLNSADQSLEDRANTGNPAVAVLPPEDAFTSMRPAGAEDCVRQKDTSGEKLIAVIGMAGRFPGARNVDEFWSLLAEGRSAVTGVPPERWDAAAYFDADPDKLDKTYCSRGGFIADIDKFDPAFFSMSGREALLTDPAQRLFLEQCWAAIENAGYDPASLSGSRCGVFAGIMAGDYEQRLILAGVAREAQAFWGNAGSVVAGRVAYVLNLRGPAISADTACSSSLVAINMACQSLLAGECGQALAGGIFISATPNLHVAASNARMLSPDGLCKAFDARADGFVPGEGVGVLVLKPLAAARRDGDQILGLIRGFGTNQDGRTNGIIAPSLNAQTDLEIDVYRRAGIDPATIGYVEAHGTGTKLGDPIEIEALTAAFRHFTDRRGDCPIGSVKTNIGHAIAAAGIASVIKVLLAMRHGRIPPSIAFSRPNDRIDFANSPFYVVDRLTDWNPGPAPRRAAVSSFGFSGTNAHLVIEEAPAEAARPPEVPNRPYLLAVSARNETALRRRIEDLLGWLDSARGRECRLGDLAFTLSLGRTHFTHRRAFVAASLEELQAALRAELHGRAIPASAPPADERRARLSALAHGYIQGELPQWLEILDPGSRRLSLPAYPFKQESYWVPLPAPAVSAASSAGPAPSDTAGSAPLPDALAGYLYVPLWMKKPAAPGEPRSRHGARVIAVMAGGSPALAEMLERFHGPVERIPAEESEAFLAQAGETDVIFYLAGPAGTKAGSPQVLNLFRLTKGLIKDGSGNRPLSFNLITTGAYAALPGEVPDPEGASLHGFLQCVAKEYPAWSVSRLDLSATGEFDARCLDALVPEGDTAAAWRNGKRYVRILHPAELPSPAEGAFKPGGVYVIAGGMGGVGQVFARYLATAFKAKLALLGRSPRDTASDPILAALRQTGGEVIYLRAGLSDARALSSAFAQIKERFGRIDGVIHSAMHFAPRPAAEMDDGDLLAALAPKREGVLTLAGVLAGEPLDFLMMFSSAQSFTGNAGRSAYAAACQYQDALAEVLRHRLDCAVRVVNWGYWETNEGRLDADVRRASSEVEGAVPLTPGEGIEAVRRILPCAAPQVLALHAGEHVLRLMGAENRWCLRQVRAVKAPPIESLASLPAPAAGETALADSLRTLENYGRLALLRAFQTMGAFRQPGEEHVVSSLRQKLGIIASYSRLFDALLELLAQGGFLVRDGERVRTTALAGAPETAASGERAQPLPEDNPEIAAHVHLIRTCLARYPEILRGAVKATSVIFPNACMDLVAPIYAGNVFADYANGLTIQAVTAYAAQRLPTLAPGERIRILEIGAGTGGTTRPLLPHIAHLGNRLEYVYTDVSQAFTQYGEEKFGANHPFMCFQTLDIEAPVDRGRAAPEGGYDLVLATNVLHATRDIRASLQRAKSLLARGGWLVLNELTHPHAFATVCFGLLEGWWRFNDAELRLPHAPLLAPHQWRRLLSEEGFDAVLTRGPAEALAGSIGHHVFIARSDGLIRLQTAMAACRDEASGAEHCGPAVAAREPPAAAPYAGAAAAGVTALVAEILQLPAADLDAHTPLMDLGLDSLLAVTLAKRVASHFAIALTPTDLFEQATIARLAAHVASQTAAPPAAAAAPYAGAAAEAGVTALVAEILQLPAAELDAHTPLMDLGLDSLLAVTLAKRVASHFAIALTPTDLFEQATIARLAAHVASQTAAPPAAAAAPNAGAAAEAGVTALVAEILQLPAADLDAHTPLMDLGLDSLLAVTLAKRVASHFAIALTPTDLFEQATIARLAAHVAGQTAARPAAAAALAPSTEAVAARPSGPAFPAAAAAVPQKTCEEDIAIIGLAGRFPKARNVAAFWDNLVRGIDAVDIISRWPLADFYDPDRSRPGRAYCKHGGLLEGIDEFDPLFFGISPKQAELMDPRQRLFLQEAWTALETAGLAPPALAGRSCGIFAGCEGSTDYFGAPGSIDPENAAEGFLGNSNSVLAARIAYLLDLRGPAIAVDTACSSSLVAVHLACESLRRGECELALAGGVHVMTRPDLYITLSRMGMLSASGKCRAFDQGADGFVPGEAVAVVVLKPLSRALADGDPVRAVIKASGINQDGRTNGITAPSAASQARLQSQIYQRSGIDPASISYVETHGTGTALGDPIEFEALRRSLGDAGDRPSRGLGSVKTNIGHAGAAAGVAGLIKLAEMLRHRMIPPSLHFETANGGIALDDAGFHVVTQLIPWAAPAGQPLRGAVNAFGHSGCNAHVVVESAPPVASVSGTAPARPLVFPLSAKTDEALRQRVNDLLLWLEDGENGASLADAAHTLASGRAHFSRRLAVVASTAAGLTRRLRDWLRDGAAAGTWHGTAKESKSASSRCLPGEISPEILAAEYVAGAGLPEEPAAGSLRPIDLPAYPFARERYWLTPAERLSPAAPRVHPLLVRNCSTAAQGLFVAPLSASSPLGGVTLGGTPILPPSAVPELVCAAAGVWKERPVTGLRHVAWNRPAALTGTGDLEIALFADGHETEFEISVRSGATSAIHSQGRIVHSAPPPAPSYNLAALQARCREPVEGEAAIRRLREIGVESASWSIRRCLLGDGEALAEIATAGVDAGRVAFAAIDGAIQCALLLAGRTGAPGAGVPLMPFSVAALNLYQPLPASCSAYVRQTGGSGRESACFDLWLLDGAGAPVAGLTGYTVKIPEPAGTDAREPDDNDLLALFAGIRRGEIAPGEAERRLAGGGVW